MKKISSKLFFAVMWMGLCQAWGWLFKKGEGKCSKWGCRLLGVAMTLLMGVVAIYAICTIGDKVYNKYFNNCSCVDGSCYHSEYVNRNIFFHNTEDGKGYIYNLETGEKLIRHIDWIAKPYGKDSLVCFSNGKKRGYFSKNTGKVIIEPKYNHAWIFSEGLAGIEEDGYIKFIDATGKVVVDSKMAYNPDKEGYVYHGGYCVVYTDDGEKCGLMDKTGKVVLPMEYSCVEPASDFEYWYVLKGGAMALFDKKLNLVRPLIEGTIYVGDGTIDVTMPDHTMRKYDLEGNLINDFYICNVRMLEYEKDEIVYEKKTTYDDEDYDDGFYHPRATARLRAYVAGQGYEGLMTADGHVVTMPMYKDIEAIGHDLYLCTSTNDDKIMLNGRGEIVR